jgi:hypothetical protein
MPDFVPEARRKHMYFTIYGTCESIDDASYPRETEQEDGSVKTEIVPQNQVTLTIPGMRDVVKVTFAGEVKMDPQWEERLVMLKVTCDKFTVSSGIRNKKAWASVGFHGLTIGEADSAGVAEINKQRKAQKAAAKQRRAEAQAKKLGKVA